MPICHVLGAWSHRYSITMFLELNTYNWLPYLIFASFMVSFHCFLQLWPTELKLQKNSQKTNF